MRRLLASLAMAGMAALASPALSAEPWQQAISTGLGKAGTEMPGGVYRVRLPRADLHVTLDGVTLKPGFALGSWLAFENMGRDVMVMGDLVLTEDELSPVMKRLVESGIEITAIHNHLLRASPSTRYMHVSGHGEPGDLARALRLALSESKTPIGNPAPGSVNQDLDLDTAAINQALGRKGKADGGVYAVSVPRAETPKDHSMIVPEAMSSAIAINFQPTGARKAAITGDFVLTADEVNPVLRTSRESDIEVTAVHNHMLDDEPRLFFMQMSHRRSPSRPAPAER